MNLDQLAAANDVDHEPGQWHLETIAGARQALERALQLAPDSPRAAEATKTLAAAP